MIPLVYSKKNEDCFLFHLGSLGQGLSIIALCVSINNFDVMLHLSSTNNVG